MNTTSANPRRPWLAALMSLLGGPVGQIYAGRFRRSLVLWIAGGVLLPIFAIAAVSLPTGRMGLTLILLSAIGFPILLAVDAFLVAKRRRDVPLARYQRWWVYLLAIIAFCIGNTFVANVIRTYGVEALVVPVRSMSPTILPGDRMLVDKFWRQPDRLRRNDVVVFRSEGPGSSLFVMRLVGLPGDVIEIVEEKILLNGNEWPDPHASVDPNLPSYPGLANYGPIQIPSDTFFVLGDNRRMAKDSRIMGPISFSDLHGIVRMIYWARERRFPDPGDTSNYETGPVVWSRIGARLD